MLTLILLPVAIVKARQSVAFAAMTLAMLGMMWRGEAWKYEALECQPTVLLLRQSPLPRQRSRQPLPSAESSDQEPDFLGGDRNYFLQYGATHFRSVKLPFSQNMHESHLALKAGHQPLKSSDRTLPEFRETFPSVYLAMRCLSSLSGTRVYQPSVAREALSRSAMSPAHNLHTEPAATPSDFI
jgi:hypothetical protein